MGETASQRATWEDLLATPADGTVYEVVGGEIQGQPRPLPGHGLSQGLLFSELSFPFHRGRGGPGGWWFIIEPDVRLGAHDIVVPDIAGWRRVRMPEFPKSRPIDCVPDWICELLSPSNRNRDRVDKANLYLSAGVPFYWIVDVVERSLEAFHAEGKRWVRLGAWTDGDKPAIPPFEAIELDVSAVLPPA